MKYEKVDLPTELLEEFVIKATREHLERLKEEE